MDSGRSNLAFLANACQALPSGPLSLAMICPTYGQFSFLRHHDNIVKPPFIRGNSLSSHDRSHWKDDSSLQRQAIYLVHLRSN